MTFGQKIRQLRETKRLSLADVSKNSGVHRTTIQKIEVGINFPSGKSMRSMCLKGLNLTEDSSDYKTLNQLWLTEKSGVDIDPASLAKLLSSSVMRGHKEAERFFINIAKLPKEDFAEIAKAVTRPGVMDIIRAANALLDGKK